MSRIPELPIPRDWGPDNFPRIMVGEIGFDVQDAEHTAYILHCFVRQYTCEDGSVNALAERAALNRAYNQTPFALQEKIAECVLQVQKAKFGAEYNIASVSQEADASLHLANFITDSLFAVGEMKYPTLSFDLVFCLRMGRWPLAPKL